TFLVAWRRLDDMPGGDGDRLWLYGVARRVGSLRRSDLIVDRHGKDHAARWTRGTLPTRNPGRWPTRVPGRETSRAALDGRPGSTLTRRGGSALRVALRMWGAT